MLLLICVASLALILLRPWHLPVWIWAFGGALGLVVSRTTSPAAAADAAAQGMDVYFFLAGMMLLAEVLRSEGWFDWLAAHTLAVAGGSSLALFALVYAAGIVVTAFLSNDATAVALTPAVAAALKRTRADAKPHLFACAFVSNAASFVLPISNPANLVVFNGHPPPLAQWVGAFAIPSLLSIGVTFGLGLFIWRTTLKGAFAFGESERPALTRSARIIGSWSVLAAGTIVAASIAGWPLGSTTLAGAAAGLALQALLRKKLPFESIRNVDWGIIPLVAGLFVIVTALYATGVLEVTRHVLVEASRAGTPSAVAAVAIGTAVACAIANNLPVALIAGASLHGATVSAAIRHTTLIAVDLGPNLAVSGSLATYLWLGAIQREGYTVSSFEFARIGVALTIPTLLLASLATLVR